MERLTRGRIFPEKGNLISWDNISEEDRAAALDAMALRKNATRNQNQKTDGANGVHLKELSLGGQRAAYALGNILSDDGRAQFIGNHLGLAFGDAGSLTTDDAHAENLWGTAGQGAIAAEDLVLEAAETGFHAFHDLDLHADRTTAERAADIGALVPKAGRGSEAAIRARRDALSEDHGATFEISLSGHGAVGIGQLKKTRTGESGVKLLESFGIGKLDDSDVEAAGRGRGEGENQEAERKKVAHLAKLLLARRQKQSESGNNGISLDGS